MKIIGVEVIFLVSLTRCGANDSVSNDDKVERKNSENVCNKPVCLRDAARMILWMNASVNPCDNIYEYVCGSFQQQVSKTKL